MNAWDISFSSLSVGYGDHAVLHDINATLPGGKVSVILGGSGCGKSTLLRHIIGLSRPIGGSLRIGGQDLFSLPHAEARRIRRRMGVLFQDGALLGALTLVQNVCLPLSEHLRLPRSVLREAGLRVLRMVGLEDFADYFPNQLSGGMRKRAGLARALIAEPRILLCDEPTSGLDPITAARMDALLQAMHRQYPEMTLVVVSHDLASLRCIADHVLVLREGRAIFFRHPAGTGGQPGSVPAPVPAPRGRRRGEPGRRSRRPARERRPGQMVQDLGGAGISSGPAALQRDRAAASPVRYPASRQRTLPYTVADAP